MCNVEVENDNNKGTDIQAFKLSVKLQQNALKKKSCYPVYQQFLK